MVDTDSVFEMLVRTQLADLAQPMADPSADVQPRAATASEHGWPWWGFDASTDTHDAGARADQTAPTGDAHPAWSAPGVTGQAPPADRPCVEIQAVQLAVRELQQRSPSGRPADVAALYALSEQLRGLALAELAELDATGAHLTAGAVTAATWLRDVRTVTDVSARAEVRLATSLRDDLPRVGQALRDGSITVEHTRAAVHGTRGLDATVVRDSDEAIAALLQVADPQAARAQLRERAEALNPELGRDAERRAHARRGFTIDEIANGCVLGGGLGTEDTQIVLHGFDLAVRGDRQDGDLRSLRQRRGDVLVQWARQEIAARGGDSVREDLRSARAQLLLTVTAEQLAAVAPFTLAQPAVADSVTGPSTWSASAGEATTGPGDDWPWRRDEPIADGRRAPAGGSFGPGMLVGLEALRRLACDASVSLVVQPGAGPAGDGDEERGRGELPPNPLGLRRDPRAEDPLYVGRAARVVTAAQWRALVVRDRHCVVKGCRRRPLQCEAHHVRHWLDGGASDLDNLVLLCFRHHHDHHDRGHDLQHRDGRWITSTGWGAQAPP